MLSHPDADAFIKRLVADPSDSVLRLVFADWLDDIGGIENQNWAKYIRLRTEAATRYGHERDLLREDAANLSPSLRARLKIPAARFVANFLDLLDLLPQDRLMVSLAGYQLAQPHTSRISEQTTRALHAIVLAEAQGVYAVVTDRLDPHIALQFSKILQGTVLTFSCSSADFRWLFQQCFPRVVPDGVSLESSDAEAVILSAEETCRKIVADARAEKARIIEVLAQPSHYEVRFTIGGRPTKKFQLEPDAGEQVVLQFLLSSTAAPLNIRAQRRNTSFGDGVQIEVLDFEPGA